ncbi:MAG: DNA phosphorothioation-dependent restriction protein DptG [Algicola sp.]|nr:DNA phosphorothioation-dependent restriction protein DptG [Algicola sp.]
MSYIKQNLPSTKDEIKSNLLNSYYPIRYKDKKGGFDWDSVLGHVVKTSYRKVLIKPDLDDFKAACKQSILAKLDEASFWATLEQMYFQGDELYKIAPEFLLFKTKNVKGSKPNARLGSLFGGLLQGFSFTEQPNVSLNFLEQHLFNELQQNLKSNADNDTVNESPYLPFITDFFQQDLRFLSRHPKYMLSVFKDFLRLYAQLYTAQLALNLKEWQEGAPVSKPNFFIMDSEKASDERTMIKNYGYRQMAKALPTIFPYLTMNESLQSSEIQKQPLWKVAENIAANTAALQPLNDYAKAFKESRQLTAAMAPASTPTGALTNLLELAMAQFARGEPRHEINTRYVRAIEIEMCDHFIQVRGRAGRVLVFNQDYLILLTNLAIGDNDRLRFHELIKTFEARGVYFDKQSQQVIIEFYERIGNVERMSDSGDAVYVCKTI